MSYTVSICDTPLRFEVNPGESVLQAALRQNIALPWGCGSGICGVCMGKVEKGELFYPYLPPLALCDSDVAQRKGLLCVGHIQQDLCLQIPEVEAAMDGVNG